MSDYLDFQEHEHLDGKTKIVTVNSKSSGAGLGLIKWYAPWRCYIFTPMADTFWSNGCLNQIVRKIDQLMMERGKP